MNGDEAVQKTNDDAQQSKAACVAMGYFKDDFVKYFVRKQGMACIQCCNHACHHGLPYLKLSICSTEVTSHEPRLLYKAEVHIYASVAVSGGVRSSRNALPGYSLGSRIRHDLLPAEITGMNGPSTWYIGTA